VTKGLRPMLWILSSLAVLWIVIALIGFFSMGGMMGSTGGMHGGGMMSGMQGSGMAAGWVAGMVLELTLTWAVMLGLAGIFVYLVLTARRST
jgi:hypothetical protein